jgi:hypothetical protein
VTALHVRQTVSRQAQKQQHHWAVLVRLIVGRATAVAVVVVGVGCLGVFTTSLLGLLELGVCRCVRWLMSFLSCFVRVLGVGVVMG